jgi:hypothetical protein
MEFFYSKRRRFDPEFALMKARNRRFRHRLLCLTPMMQQRLFCGPQHQIVSYYNDFAVKWRCGFDWKQWS